MTKRPIFLLPTEGKSLEQIQAEACEALQAYLDARDKPALESDEGSPE